MLVFGDASRRERAADKLHGVGDALARVARLPPGLPRHSALVAALIEAGELAQGVADRAFADDGCDRPSAAADAAMTLTMAIARACAVSWRSRFADAGGSVADELRRCGALLSDDVIETKQPEGYAFYLLYPESYLAATAGLAGRRWQVIGVRSIGTSLACMVAVGLGADTPITLRPVGRAFARTVAADRSRIDRNADAYALVDEGPGLSGSSLGAVARWLLDAGIAEERIHVFAAHRLGPGPHASATTRSLWQRLASSGRLHVTAFDDLVLRAAAPEHRLATWVAALVGPLQAPLREIGGGVWRELQRRSGVDLPPVHPWQERRKFLAVADGRRWLVKFNGLGERGERKLARARALGEAGFTARPIGSCHGFLVEHWRDDAEPLPATMSASARAALLERIADYLAFRARSFPAPSSSGASILTLAAMAHRNTEEALGTTAAATWQHWSPQLVALQRSVRPIETDNRMHAWEWLATSGGVAKTDALDHHAGHDLIGCQDVAWDIAGAVVELDLSAREQRRLQERVGELTAIPTVDQLLRFYAGCYPAFQLGYYDDAARSTDDAIEAARLQSARERYARRLREVLASPAFRPSTL